MLSEDELLKRFTDFPDLADIEKLSKYHKFDIYFEKLSMDGLSEMHKYSIDERLYEFFEFDAFTDISETKEYINKLLERMSTKNQSRSTSYWFIRRKSDDRLLGSAGLLNLNYQRQSIEWGYGMDPNVWGMGYILQVQEILKIIAFDVLNLNRLGGLTSIKNENTINSAVASGMLQEGVIKDFMNINGEYHDGWQYGMTAKNYHESNVASISVLVNMNDIVSVVSSVLTEEEITAESGMENTFSWDSLNHMAIIVALKSRLSIDFSPVEISNTTSIKKIYKKAHEG